MNGNEILRIKTLNKSYQEAGKSLKIINDLEFQLEKGEFVSILGKSGSGKTTLLNLIALLDKPDSGEIIYNGKNILELNEKKKNIIRNKKIGFVFQFHYLLPEFNSLENVMMPAMINGKYNKKEIKKRAYKILEEVEMEHRSTHKPNELSGGEKQRVAIARALMNSPSLILADEPTGNLDEETSKHIGDLLKRINKGKEQSILIVTHSRELAELSDRQVFLKKGKLKKVI